MHAPSQSTRGRILIVPRPLQEEERRCRGSNRGEERSCLREHRGKPHEPIIDVSLTSLKRIVSSQLPGPGRTWSNILCVVEAKKELGIMPFPSQQTPHG
jgi:hypothetical protein